MLKSFFTLIRLIKTSSSPADSSGVTYPPSIFSSTKLNPEKLLILTINFFKGTKTHFRKFIGINNFNEGFYTLSSVLEDLNFKEIFLKINHKLVNQIVIDIQRNPNLRLIEIKDYLKELPFEDIYSLKTLYESIMDHLQRDNLKEGLLAYDWISNQYKLSTSDDSLHTYRFFLNKRPVKIMDA